MVGGNHVDGAVLDARNQCLPVFCAAKGGIHFEAPILLQIPVVHNQIVGAGFAGNVHPLGLCLADKLYALLGGDVAYMVGAAGFPCQLQIPGNLPPLAFGADTPVAMGLGVSAVVDVAAPQQVVDLAVGHNHLAQCLGPEHGGGHHFLRLHPLAVIGEGDAVGGHALQVGQALALLPQGDGTVGVDMDAGIPVNELLLLLEVGRAVGDRVQVGHGAHIGVAPPGGGPAAC